MDRQEFLRAARLVLLGAFFLACILFALINMSNFPYPYLIKYAPLVTLVLFGAFTAADWIMRRRRK